MSLVGQVKLELVQTVGVVVTGIAPQLNRIGDIQELQLPLIGWPAFLDVIDVVQALEVLVCLAVELKVGLQVGFVTAELANKVAGYNNGDFVFSISCAIMGQVLRQYV